MESPIVLANRLLPPSPKRNRQPLPHHHQGLPPPFRAQQIDQVVEAWGHTQPDAVSTPTNASVTVISQLTKPIERPLL
jgi:hypothetical protein